MKKRAFVTTLTLFLVFLNGLVLIISVLRLNESLDLVKERSLAEYSYISTALTKDIVAVENREIAISDVIVELINPYLYFSNDNKIKLTIYDDTKLIFSNLDENLLPKADLSLIVNGTQHIFKEEIGENTLLYVAGNIQTNDNKYSLIHSHDITELLNSWSQSNNTLYTIVAVLALFLSVFLILLLNQIFKPLSKFLLASQTIASGDFQKRLEYKGNDELSNMAKSFNSMTDTIEKKMDELVFNAEQKQRFVDNFAHEIRTPLTAIYGYAEYLQKAKISEDDKLFATSYIMSESQRMQELAYQLLEIATMRNNKINKKDVDVSTMFFAVNQTVAQKADDKNISFEYIKDVDTIYCDSGLIQCLIINLVENAMKACNIGGTVSVGVRIESDTVILYVKDDGKGMTEDQLHHITEAFYRVDKSRNRKDGGTGLGLSICEEIANAHDSKLKFTSEINNGTLVEIVLQLHNKSMTT